MVHFTLGSDIMITPDRSLLHNLMTKFALHRADYVISTSQTMTRKLVDRLGYPEACVLTQQYGVTDRVINYPTQKREYDVVSNRNWVPNSNVDYLLKILTGVRSVRTALVGRSVDGNESLGENIRMLSQNLAECQLFPHLPYDQNIDLVAKSRFMASVTNSDGASLSVMEGMALGTVPILSDIPANREWVKHGINGFLIPLGNVEAAQKIVCEALALDEDRREEMAKKCKQVIQEKGSLTRNMKRVSHIMINLIESPK
jgi:glycosyltransferase involved in cell wall biosynthesis